VKDFAGQLKADARPDASQPGVSLPGITPQDFLLKEELPGRDTEEVSEQLVSIRPLGSSQQKMGWQAYRRLGLVQPF